MKDQQLAVVFKPLSVISWIYLFKVSFKHPPSTPKLSPSFRPSRGSLPLAIKLGCWVFSLCSCRLLSICPCLCWRGYSRVHQRGERDQILRADISGASLSLCLLSAADAGPRRIGWWRPLLKRQRKKDAPCCDFCRPVSFILPLPRSAFIVSSFAFFCKMISSYGSTSTENTNTAKIPKED